MARTSGAKARVGAASAKLAHAPRRAVPQQPLDRGDPLLDDLDDLVAPPLHGKTHPPAEMDDATPTLDDEKRSYRHHPADAGATEFGFDPEAADAAADLAGDLGSTFLSGATRGEDMSDLVAASEDRLENDLPFVVELESDLRREPPPRARRRR